MSESPSLDNRNDDNEDMWALFKNAVIDDDPSAVQLYIRKNNNSYESQVRAFREIVYNLYSEDVRSPKIAKYALSIRPDTKDIGFMQVEDLTSIAWKYTFLINGILRDLFMKTTVEEWEHIIDDMYYSNSDYNSIYRLIRIIPLALPKPDSVRVLQAIRNHISYLLTITRSTGRYPDKVKEVEEILSEIDTLID